MMEKIPNHTELPKPVSIIFSNRARLAEKLGVKEVYHTPPAMDHYPHGYPWDQAAAAIILAHFGYAREAETEVFSIFHRQRSNGMVTNQQRVKGLRNHDPELLTFTEPWASADYSQPPIWATATAAVYKAKKEFDPYSALLFLEETLPKNVRSFDYFRDNRRIAPGNSLIFNVKAEETGRDGDEALNGYAPKLPSRGPNTPYLIELINAGSHHFGRMALGGLNRINGWDPQRIKRYYAPLDPMFNSIYADNMRVVGRLAGELDETMLAERFYDEANAVEERVFSDLYEPNANEGKGAFLVHGNRGPKEEISISCIGPLMLDNLPIHLLESSLGLMDDHLDAPFPLPTLSTKSAHYDPEGRRPHTVWDGEVMMIGNWLVARALRKQASRAAALDRPDLAARCLDWSENRIIPKSKYLLRQGYYEGFSPQTGRPRRTKTVKGNFVWDGLIETL